MSNYEKEHHENLASNRLTARLIADGKDGFDCEIASQANELLNRVCQHRSITRTAGVKVVTDFLEVNP